MPDPTPHPALPSETERLIAAIERLTRSMDGLRQAFVVEEPQPGEEFPVPGRPPGTKSRDATRHERSAIEAAARAALASPAAGVSALAVVEQLRSDWPRLGRQMVVSVFRSMGLKKIRSGVGPSRPALWVRR